MQRKAPVLNPQPRLEDLEWKSHFLIHFNSPFFLFSLQNKTDRLIVDGEYITDHLFRKVSQIFHLTLF